MDYNTNELYNTILKYIEDEDKAKNMFSCIMPYMLGKFGEEGVDSKHLSMIMPLDLYKNSIFNNESYFKDFTYIIMRYKIDTESDIGFPMKRYEDLFNTNQKYENALKQKRIAREQAQIRAVNKKLKKKKTKTAIIKEEDFDKDLIPTKENIIKRLQEKYDITLVKENQIKSGFHNDLTNKRVGKLVYNTPFRINSIKDPSIYWIGTCDCGNFRIVQGGRVNDYQCCSACENSNENLVGNRFGHLEVIEQKYLLSGKHSLTVYYKCKCDCGSTIIVQPRDLYNRTNCGKQCKYAIEARQELAQQNRSHLLRLFEKQTNVTKLGKTTSNANSSTGYLGVTLIPSTGKYMAYITFQRKTELLGTYPTPEKAYAVRLSAQNILHKEFLKDLENDTFIQKNKYLKRFLNKVKKSLEKVDEIIEEIS